MGVSRINNWTSLIKNIGFILIAVFTYAQSISQESYQSRSSEARRADHSAIIQINKLKQLRLELSTTSHYDTLGLTDYFIAFRYDNRTDPPIPDSVLKYSILAMQNFEASGYVEYRKQNTLSFLLKHYNGTGRHLESINTYLTFRGTYRVESAEVESLIITKLAEAYRSTRENEAALSVLQAFIQTPTFINMRPDYKSNVFYEISNTQYDQGLYNDAYESIEAAMLAEGLRKNPDQRTLFNLITQKALILSATGQYDAAYRVYMAYLEDDISSEHTFTMLSNAYDNWHKAGRYKMAASFAEKAYRLSSQLGMSALKTYTASYNYSESHRFLGSVDSAIYYTHQALEHLHQQNEHAEIDYQLIKLNFNQVLNYEAMYQTHKESPYLDSALIYMDRINTLVPTWIDNVLFEGSLLHNKAEIAEWYDKGIDLAVAADSAQLFIDYSDKTKALSLLKEKEWGDQELINKDSLQSLYQNLIEEESGLALSQMLDTLSVGIDSIAEQLLDNKDKQRDILHQLQALGVVQHSTASYSLSDLTDQDLSIVYYHMTDSTAYACHLTADEQHIYQLGNRVDLERAVLRYSDKLRERSFSFEEARELYRVLLAPMGMLQQRLIIIPDQQLSLIPFESLVNYDSQYVIQNHEVSYALSYRHFMRQTNVLPPIIENFYIVSPDYDESYEYGKNKTKNVAFMRASLSYLEHTKNEVTNLTNAFGTSVFDGISITKSEFFNSLASADIFHFTGHAISVLGHDNLSFLALGKSGDKVDQDIFVNEISNRKTNAALVTLNACDTGVGQVIKGEGVFNLARSFFKAGANAVMSSLWAIDDYSSSEITSSFYAYLKQGHRKSKALQLAKLDYIENVKTDKMRNPYYWSGLIISGNPAPLYSNTAPHYYVISLLVLVGLFIFGKRYSTVFA